MAFIDFDLDPRELETIYQIGRDRGISSEEINAIILNPHQGYDAPSSEQEKVEYLYDYARLIVADEMIEGKEIELFQRICEKFGIDPLRIEQLVACLLDAAKEHKSINEVYSIIEKL